MEDDYDDYYDYHWTQDRPCLHGEDADCNCRKSRINSLFTLETCESCGQGYTCEMCHDCSRKEVECTCPLPQWTGASPEARKEEDEGLMPF